MASDQMNQTAARAGVNMAEAANEKSGWKNNGIIRAIELIKNDICREFGWGLAFRQPNDNNLCELHAD